MDNAKYESPKIEVVNIVLAENLMTDVTGVSPVDINEMGVECEIVTG